MAKLLHVKNTHKAFTRGTVQYIAYVNNQALRKTRVIRYMKMHFSYIQFV